MKKITTKFQEFFIRPECWSSWISEIWKCFANWLQTCQNQRTDISQTVYVLLAYQIFNCQ